MHPVNETQKALNLLQKGTTRFPWYARLWTLRGYILYKAARYQEAASNFSRALLLNPTAPFALFMRGRAREEMQQPAKAAVDHMACIACHPTRTDSYFALIWVLINIKLVRNAARFIERVNELDIDDKNKHEADKMRSETSFLAEELDTLK